MARSSTMSGPVEGVAAAPALSHATQGVCSSGEGWDRSITAGTTGLPTPAQRDEHALLQQLRPSRCKVSCSPRIAWELTGCFRRCTLSLVCTGSRLAFMRDSATQIELQLAHEAHARKDCPVKRCTKHPALRPESLQDLPGAGAHDAAARRSAVTPSCGVWGCATAVLSTPLPPLGCFLKKASMDIEPAAACAHRCGVFAGAHCNKHEECICYQQAYTHGLIYQKTSARLQGLLSSLGCLQRASEGSCRGGE